MSRDITKLGHLAEGVARLIDPDAWQRFDGYCERKAFSAVESAEYFGERMAFPHGRLRVSVDRAQAVLAFILDEGWERKANGRRVLPGDEIMASAAQPQGGINE